MGRKFDSTFTTVALRTRIAIPNDYNFSVDLLIRPQAQTAAAGSGFAEYIQ
ncbi:MAG: hypothetical protein ACYTAS_12030 [Planctomycetota bacterium]